MQRSAEAVVIPVFEQPTRIRWLMIGLIFVVDVLMFIDRVNISIAAKYIIPEYGLTEVQMGSVFSAFVLGYALLQIPGGWLGDRFGPRRVLTVAIFWWSVFTAVTAIAGELFLVSLLGIIGSFIVVRVLIGAGEAAALPNRNRLVANWIPPHERALAIGIGGSGSMLGAALTPPLIVAIMLTLGWRAAFYLAGAVGIGIAVLWYWLARDRPEQHPWLNHAELRYITQTAEEAALPRRDASSLNPWPALLRNKSLWCVTGAYFTIGYIAYLYFSWFYLYLVNVRGFSLTHGGFYGSLPFLTAAVVAPLAGWLSDHLSQRYGKRIGRCMLGIVGLVLGAGWICAGAAATHPLWAVVFLFSWRRITLSWRAGLFCHHHRPRQIACRDRGRLHEHGRKFGRRVVADAHAPPCPSLRVGWRPLRICWIGRCGRPVLVGCPSGTRDHFQKAE